MATIFVSGLLLFSSYVVFLRSYILDLNDHAYGRSATTTEKRRETQKNTFTHKGDFDFSGEAARLLHVKIKVQGKLKKKICFKISSLWRSQTNRDEGSKACRDHTNIG